VSDQLHAQAALPLGKNPWYPMDGRPSGAQSACLIPAAMRILRISSGVCAPQQGAGITQLV